MIVPAKGRVKGTKNGQPFSPEEDEAIQAAGAVAAKSKLRADWQAFAEQRPLLWWAANDSCPRE